MGVARFVGSSARFLGRHAKESFERNSGRSINNLFTGVGLSAKGKRIGGGLLGAYAGYEVLHQGYRYNHDPNLLPNMDDRGVQSLPGTRGDGMGYTPTTTTPDLGATGDLVFALHNLRHGG